MVAFLGFTIFLSFLYLLGTMIKQLLLAWAIFNLGELKIVGDGGYVSPSNTFHNPSILKEYLDSVTDAFPSMTHLYELGNSVEGLLAFRSVSPQSLKKNKRLI